MRKGFTLIELLVVIAIIGLLASIVTVSLSSSQDRAKQAKIESFAAQVHHALAADAVGIWDFDDAAAGTANDTSGLKNNGVFPGGSSNPTSATNRYDQAGKAYSFDGGDYITAGSGTTIDNLITSSWTVSGWIKRNELGVSHTLAGMGDSYGAEQDRGFFLYVSVGNKATIFYRPTKGGADNGFTGNVTIDMNWHHLTFVRNKGTNLFYIYVDGVLDNSGGTASTDITAFTLTRPFGIGVSNLGSSTVGPYMNGKIDEVRMYKSALSSAQIQQLYAEGLGEHSLTQNNQ